MKLLLVTLASITGLGILVEVGLRLTMGLANPPLYIADPEIGYLLAPQQKLRRSGNLIVTNQYSMRHEELSTQAAESDRIMLLGDSVVNGSWWTDQSQTLASLLRNQLQTARPQLEVLNISANSWGPRNELAYIKRFGLFESKTLVLVINTDDLWATEPSSLVVGRSYSYPEQAPPLALMEYYQLFVAPPKAIPELEQLRQATTPQERLEQNLAAIEELHNLAQEAGTKFMLVLTPLRQEFQAELNLETELARQRLQVLATQAQIPYLDFLSIWQDFPQPEFLYRDQIHPSPQGYTKMVEAIAQYLEDLKNTALAVDRTENSERRVSIEKAKQMPDLD